MAADYSICLGTVGWGVWHSPDAGKSWIRHRAPFPLNSRIQALVAHPTKEQTVFAGGDTGLFVSHDGGARWQRIGTDGALPTIWSLTIDPVDPDILFAGTRPAGIYRSQDGGRQWKKLAVDIASECSIGIPFVTSVIVDPDDHRVVFAGVEIDGVFRSLDGGDSWTHLETGLYDPDTHSVTIAPTQAKRIYASTAREMFTSNDLGDTWRPLGIKEKWPLPYARGMVVKADEPGVLFAGCGETTTGEKGTCSAPQTLERLGRSCHFRPSPMPLCGALPRIPLTPTALWPSACSVRSMSVRTPARPGARSHVSSARSGPQPGCQTDFLPSSRRRENPGRENGRTAQTTLCRNSHFHLGNAVNEVGISPFRSVHHLDWRKPFQDFLPQDRQLHLCQPIADAAVNTEPEGQMLPGPRAVDDKTIGVLDLLGVPVARDIPHRDLLPLTDAPPVQLGVAQRGATHVYNR